MLIYLYHQLSNSTTYNSGQLFSCNVCVLRRLVKVNLESCTQFFHLKHANRRIEGPVSSWD